jgi:long-chain acyl-CoA synthetase
MTSGSLAPPSRSLPDEPGIASGERFVSRHDLLVRAARCASALESLGVGRFDAVAILMRNDIAFVEATLAAGMLGAYAVPVNWHFREAEASYVLSDSKAKVLVGHTDLLAALEGAVPLDMAVRQVPTPPEIAAAYGIPDEACRPVAGHPDWEEWEPWAASFPPKERDPANRPASMIYTSGTTGRPKGVRRSPLSDAQAQGVSRMNAEVLGIRPGMRTLIPAPLYHTAPNAYTLAAFLSKGSLLLAPKFDALGLLRAIEREGLTHLHLVPTMFSRLLQLPEEVRKAADVSSLEHVVHAAAPCPPEIKRRMIEWWGPVIYEYYGSTESGAVTFSNSEEWLAHPGTVGRPLEGALVRILRSDGTEAAVGEPGEVFTRHPSFTDFTYQGDHEARMAIERDGLITSGDVGYLDADGYLYLCGRAKEMVISGGVNLYPAEVEAVLAEMPGVADCAVFGIPDDDLGEVLAAAIEPSPSAQLSEDEVKSFMRQQLASMKVPRVVTFHSSLPREDSGKIFKRILRDPYWEGTGRSI